MQRIVIETDIVVVAAKLNGMDQDRSIYGTLVEGIKLLLRDFGDTVVQAIRREPNGAAHLMVKVGCEKRINRIWRVVPPDHIVDKLVMDISTV
jgi:hypothetical protein